jgi:hypothetical protein
VFSSPPPVLLQVRPLWWCSRDGRYKSAEGAEETVAHHKVGKHGQTRRDITALWSLESTPSVCRYKSFQVSRCRGYGRLLTNKHGNIYFRDCSICRSHDLITNIRRPYPTNKQNNWASGAPCRDSAPPTTYWKKPPSASGFKDSSLLGPVPTRTLC